MIYWNATHLDVPSWQIPLYFSWPILYYYDWVFGHMSQPKKLLTQNVFLLNFLIFFVFFLTKIFQICEHLVVIVQYHHPPTSIFSGLGHTTLEGFVWVVACFSWTKDQIQGNQFSPILNITFIINIPLLWMLVWLRPWEHIDGCEMCEVDMMRDRSTLSHSHQVIVMLHWEVFTVNGWMGQVWEYKVSYPVLQSLLFNICAIYMLSNYAVPWN